MHRRSRFTYLKGLVLSGLTFAAFLVSPRVAASQARGTLQVTATVVQAQASFAGLKAASQAAQSWMTGRSAVSNDVSTVAQVQVAYSAAGAEPALVISIDYVKN